MTPLANAEDDAYRLYNIGVGNEALGYKAETPASAKSYFEKAVIDYRKAGEANPHERYFIEPVNRIEIALEHYKKLAAPAKSLPRRQRQRRRRGPANELRRRWRGLCGRVMLVALAGTPLAAQEGCAVSKDLVVRALELVSATPARDDLSNGILLLKQAEEACDENGDAWYYRSLFERKLGQGNPQYSLGKARERNSAALKSEDDPFHLATPATRGVHVAHAGTPRRAPTGPRAEMGAGGGHRDLQRCAAEFEVHE